MATLSKLKPGQVLWTVTTQKMGNTTIRQKVVHSVVVQSVDLEAGFAVARWNSNAPRKYFERDIAKWRVSKPKPKGTWAGMPSY